MVTTEIEAFNSWYDSLKKYSGMPAKGTIAGALVILERLKENLDLSIAAHTATGGTQISGLSGSSVAKILAAHGETRPFASEAGRTNRGVRGDMEGLLLALSEAGFEGLKDEVLLKNIDHLQQFLVEQVRAFHNLQKIKVEFDNRSTAWHFVRQVLRLAREKGKAGQVAQHLVGAKLQLRFPHLPIPNESYSTADVQTGRSGDFQISDSVFHVTMAPMPAVYAKCVENIRRGVRPFLLVPDDRLLGARQSIDPDFAEQVAVESIESFVSQNVEELSTFDRSALQRQFLELLTLYNRRIDEVEMDKSIQIEIPENLARSSGD